MVSGTGKTLHLGGEMIILGIFLIVCACIFALMSGFLVDKDAGWIPLGLSAIVCAIFGSLVLGGII